MTNHHATTGLSIGATNLAGTRAGQSVIHPAALRTDSGAWLSGFVERIGDPVPLIASDGTAHQPQRLLADALGITARAVGHPLPVTDIAIAVPAHWTPDMVGAIASELPSATMIPDTIAAVAALQSQPGLPSHGVLVLCDFGGSGAGISLIDAGSSYRPIGETVRYPEFSGDLVDQLILAEVLSGCGPADPTGTAMVTSLTRLREAARLAKHRLSSETATALTAGDTSIRLTRAELEGLIDAPFSGFLTALSETLNRFGVRPGDVSAVATFGGVAQIPMVTQRLSSHLRVPVITAAHPELTSAAGAAMAAGAARAVVTPTTYVHAQPPGLAPAMLAWADDIDPGPEPDPPDWIADRPVLQFTEPDREEEAAPRRGPLIAFGVAAAAALTALAAYGLTSFDRTPDQPVSVVATVTATTTTESAAPIDGPAPLATGPVVVPVAQVPARRVPIRSAPATVTAPHPAPAAPAAATPSPTSTVPPTTVPTTTVPTTTVSTTATTPPPPTSTAPPTTAAPSDTTPVPIDPGPGDGETTPPVPIDPGDGGSE